MTASPREIQMAATAAVTARVLDLIAGVIEYRAGQAAAGPLNPEHLRADARDVRRAADALRELTV